MSENKISVSVLNETQIANTDIERTLFELDKQIDLLSSHADKIDYFVDISQRKEYTRDEGTLKKS